jgi:transcription antitermination factor NusA-like protein
MSKRPVRALFGDTKNLTAEDISQSEILKTLLKVEVPKSISQAVKEKKLYAPIFEINSSAHYIEIHRRDWIAALETCVVFHVENEDYERCTEINALIKEIRDGQKKPKIKLK